MAGRRVEQECGAARAQHAVAEFGHFEDGRYGLGDAPQLAALLEAMDEIA
ncbi:hypothetical protein BMMON2_20250 [Burkholderia mallei]